MCILIISRKKFLNKIKLDLHYFIINWLSSPRTRNSCKDALVSFIAPYLQTMKDFPIFIDRNHDIYIYIFSRFGFLLLWSFRFARGVRFHNFQTGGGYVLRQPLYREKVHTICIYILYARKDAFSVISYIRKRIYTRSRKERNYSDCIIPI